MRERGWAELRHLRGIRLLALLGAVSLLAAVLADRFAGLGGPWLWNLDTPIWDYPLASFFHDALAHGQLPLWNDNLGLGFPLYAEGQIGALYPPNWLIFQLPPLVALDAARIAHLSFLGIGTGLLALRLSGSRLGAVMAAGAIVLSGGIVSKLEWTNLIEAVAWLPWVLLPLVRRPTPTRAGLMTAGILWGVMALAGHPNVWMLTGLTSAILLLAIRPRFDTLVRLVTLGVIAAGIGAVQLLPTALLWSMSTRSAGLAADDLFGATAMPFDLLGTAFANVFVRYQLPAQDLWSTWYPGGGWSPPEIGAYVGLPLLALAATSVRLRRARPLVAVAAFMIVFPLVGGLRPGIWAALPVWNAIHAPVKGYMVLDLMVVLLGAMAIGRLQRGRIRWQAAGWLVVGFAAAYGALEAIVFLTPDLFRDLVRRYWHWPPPDQADVVWREARDTVSQLWPVAFELALGAAAVWLLYGALAGRRAAWPLAGLVLLPLALLSPPINQVLDQSAFSYAATPLVQSLAASRPTRVMAVNDPLYWSGMPDQLAAAGIPTLEMFSSLSLLAPTRTYSAAVAGAPDYALARAIGVDTLVTVNAPCPGSVIVAVPAENAVACRLAGALRPPYWLPASTVQVAQDAVGSPIRPVTATFSPEAALAEAQPVSVIEWTSSGGQLAVNAPAAGWVFTGRAWWPGWTTTIDGNAASVDSAFGAQLVFVAPGFHVIRQSLDLWDVRLGLLIALATLLAAVAWARWGFIRRRPSPGMGGRPLDAGLPLHVQGPARAPGGAIQTVSRRMVDRVLARGRGHSALIVTVASLVAWSSWYLVLGPRHPYGDLSNGIYTDHFSHMNTARLFTHAGIDIWTKPLTASVVPLSPEQRAALPPDMTTQAGQLYPVFTVPGWPADKPFVSSWAEYPRFHPPGDMVLTAPVAVLYSATGLSFSGANRLLILSFLALAHISLFVLLKSGLSMDRVRPIGFLVLVVVYAEVIHWSLEGFYEAVLIAPLVLCGRYLANGRGLQAIAMFALAANVHFRAYFFAPLAIYGAYLVVRDRQWRTWTRRDHALAILAAVLSAISLGVFSMIAPWLRQVPATNPVGLAVGHPDAAAIATLLVVVGVLAAAFAWSRSWLDVALLGWLTVTVLLLQQTWEWDVLTILAWLALPIGAGAAKRYLLVRDVRLVAVLFLGMFVFKDMTLLDPTWLAKVF